jgi:RNA polymerase sigma-70 factor (ECF subfamily)
VNAAGEGAYAAPSMQAETTALMTRVKHGDREAFDQLVERMRSRAFRVAQSLVGSRDDALDLSQEAFLRTYRARETYREGDPFLPWFQRILRNTCYSWLRQNGRVRQKSINAGTALGDESGDWELPDDDPHAPDDPALNDERAQLFWRAFRKLPAREREILSLRHFKELSYNEIAAMLDIPVGTVMSRLFYARRRLREGLGDALDDESPAGSGWNEV